jgi:hypothetical protein
VLTLIGIVVIVLAVSGLALCAMRSKVRLKVHASLLKTGILLDRSRVPGRAARQRVAAWSSPEALGFRPWSS